MKFYCITHHNYLPNTCGATPATGTINVTVSSDTSSKFIFQNSANVIFARPTAGGGSATLSLMGGTGDDFVIDATSSVTIGGNAADGNVVMNLFAGVTGSIAGNLTLSGTGVHRFTSQTQYGLVFKPTAVCTLATTPASSGYPFGSATQGVNNGIVFQSGATLITSGTYSPMGVRPLIRLHYCCQALIITLNLLMQQVQALGLRINTLAMFMSKMELH